MKSFTPVRMVVAIFALWLLALMMTYFLFDTWQDRGLFGDLFGSVNALFSGLAFAGLIYTILLQREELALQRDELKLQREEMVASRSELAAQVAAQNALFRATIGQIRVAAEQVRVEAIKMDAESKSPGARDLYIQNIKEVATQIDGIAEELGHNVSGD